MWNDGTPLTVDDALYSMLRYGNPCNGAGRSGLWRTYVVPLEVVDHDARDCTVTNADDAIRVVDDKTIEFHPAFASGAFIKFLAIDYVKVLPKHLLEQGIDLNQAENILEHNSGSGPFILEEYQSGNFYNVNRNPDYFKAGLPYFDRIEHYIITVQGNRILIWSQKLAEVFCENRLRLERFGQSPRESCGGCPVIKGQTQPRF